MRKTFVLLLSAAFVASIPTIASAKKSKHGRHHRPAAVQPVNQDDAGPRFVASALYQLVVPWEKTFGPRR